jgi:hypothetical protein
MGKYRQNDTGKIVGVIGLGIDLVGIIPYCTIGSAKVSGVIGCTRRGGRMDWRIN